MRLLTLIFVCAAILSCVVPVFAQETQASLLASYSRDRESISWRYIDKRKMLPVAYTNALRRIELSFTDSGNLNGVLATRKEKEQFVLADRNGGGIPDSPTVPAILELRTTYMKATAAVDLEEKKEILASADRYVGRLKTLEVELTKSGRIDEAVAVSTKRKRVTEAADVVAAAADVKKAAATRTTVALDNQSAAAASSKPAVAVEPRTNRVQRQFPGLRKPSDNQDYTGKGLDRRPRKLGSD